MAADVFSNINIKSRFIFHYCDISGPVLIVLEYLPYGDLLGYLRKSRGHEDTYNSGEKSPNSRLTEKDLLSFAWMIADGMSYLATMKVNHVTGRLHHHFSQGALWKNLSSFFLTGKTEVISGSGTTAELCT